uniref:F-box domain-containing protein n=1 Tax=Pristionchus pacificus TaxID=54126 RepID=A0A2A6BU63_PRIPA|eukprot:PDM69291.1 hypothetical protein PRIPAC_47593 [Pristionchus pacificus]
MVTLVSSDRQCFRVDTSIAQQSQTVSRLLEIGNEELFNLIVAANYLDIKELLDLGCKRVADLFKDKSPDDIRKTFGIVNDLSPEEEEQFRNETSYFDFAFPLTHEFHESDTVFRLLDLPNEIISIIFQQLNIVDRLRARVCQRLFMLEQLVRYHIRKMELIISDVSSIEPLTEKLIIILCNFNRDVSFNFIIESYLALLKKISSNTIVETLTLFKSYGSTSDFDPKELMPCIQSIPTRELTIFDVGTIDVKNDSLTDWTRTRDSLYLPRTKLTGLGLVRLYDDIASSTIALRRFRLEATNRTLMYLLRNIGITLVNNQFVSTRPDVRAFAEVSMFFGSKYYFLIGENMIITTDGGIMQYNEGELWIERHNDDGSMPDLPCFRKDIPISYIVDCDPLTVVYK